MLPVVCTKSYGVLEANAAFNSISIFHSSCPESYEGLELSKSFFHIPLLSCIKWLASVAAAYPHLGVSPSKNEKEGRLWVNKFVIWT